VREFLSLPLQINCSDPGVVDPPMPPIVVPG